MAASNSQALGGGNVSAAMATLGASVVAEAAMRSCMLRDLLDERARLFTKAEELKVMAMARVKEKMG